MTNKKIWLVILVMVLVFGMTVVGCNDDSSIYDPKGTWDFVAYGQNAIVTITGNNWVFDGPGTAYDDTGTFTQSGNVLTLYSNYWNTNIGTATITSNTTVVLTLHDPSLITGTFNGTKRN